jgi:hypothetical protein
MKIKTIFGLLLISCLVKAETEISGFGTIRLGFYDIEEGQITYPFITHIDEVTAVEETRLGLRADHTLSEDFSLTGQVLMEAKRDYDLDVQWAYIRYRLTEASELRVGRLVNPIAYRSEYEKVGYSHYYERLPTQVYLQFDFSTLDGVSYYRRVRTESDIEVAFQLIYGTWDGEVFLSGPRESVRMPLKDILSYNLSLNYKRITFFTGAMTSLIHDSEFDEKILYPSVQPAMDAAIAFGATEAEVNEFKRQIGWNNNNGIYIYGGISYDSPTWLFEVEGLTYGITNSSDIFNNNFFVSLGYHFRNVTPLVYYAQGRQDGYKNDFSSITHPILKEAALGLQKALSVREDDGIGLSVRWDFQPKIAFKAQYYQGNDSTPGVGDIRYISLGLDFVF